MQDMDVGKTTWCSAVRALAFLAALHAWAGCAATPRDVPFGEPTPATSHQDTISRAMSWSLGARRAPPPRGPARLLWREADEPLDQARQVSRCIEEADDFDSVLPAPDGERVFLAIDGVLHMVTTSGHDQAPRALPMSPAHVSIQQLLAFERGNEPVILAVVQDQRTKRSWLWALRVQGNTVVGTQVDTFDDFASVARFLQRYQAPRCQSGDEQCLVVDGYGGRTFVSLEKTRGALPRVAISELSKAGVRDVAWAAHKQPGGSPASAGRAQWILRGCTPDGE